MKTIALSLSLAIGWLVANAGVAAEPCKVPGTCTKVQTCGAADHCGRCGRACACEKHCRVVCEMKEVKKTVWVVKCEDFCAPLPSCGRGCNGCTACGDTAACGVEPTCSEGCGKNCDPCAVEKNKRYVQPKCGKVRTKKVLEKKEVVCKVPSYKCVVIYTCPNCCGSGACDGQTPAAPAKPAIPTPAPAPGKTTEKAPLPPAPAMELSMAR
jgi:hypothetical protein